MTLALVACTGEGNTGSDEGNMTTQAQLLSMVRHNGYTVATIKNPWGEGILHQYVLVAQGAALPDSLPEGTVVRTPVKNALVYSVVHSGLLAELGCPEVVKGIVDARYYSDSLVLAGLENGSIKDCGSSMAPSFEKVIELNPDAIMLSPYQNGNYGPIEKLRTAIIECADYMEQTPLGRAEWIKFYGALVGRERQADSIYNAVETAYNTLRQQRAEQGKNHPKVLTETVISGVWNVPGGQSYMARLIQDAGGIYPWADDEHNGSLSLDFNQVLAKAQDADVWLVKSFNIHSYDDIKDAYSLNDRFAAFKNRRVYTCDTNETHLFERFPFHPELLLQDFCNIFDGNTSDLIFYAPCK